MKRAKLSITPCVITGVLNMLGLRDGLKVIKNGIPADAKCVSVKIRGAWIDLMLESDSFDDVGDDNIPFLDAPEFGWNEA